MLAIKNLKKSFGERDLFTEVNLTISDKERVGLIGRNGSGKSTFLKILTGEEGILEGEIKTNKGFRILSLEQDLNFSEPTVLANVESALPNAEEKDTWKAKSILMGLGFLEKDFNSPPSDFSSGYQVRIRLAEVLVSESDLLLLDEPTNYLDIVSLRWLSRFLKNLKTAFILVSHDQQFMEEVVTHTVAIHRGRLRKMKGGPQKLMSQIHLEERVHEKTRKNQIKKHKKSEEFIRNFRAGARSAGLVQSRIKALSKQNIEKKLKKVPDIYFHFHALPCKSDSVIQANDVTFGYDADKPLIKDFNLSTQVGDRIAIIGRNGEGKSTLLRVLRESLKPQSGNVRKPPTLKVGYFGADSKDELTMQKNILEELSAIPGVTDQEVRNLCGSLLFKGETVKRKIELLSGGEKSRVCLGKVLLYPTQLLMLDEPTNHLDMESCQALSQALQDYSGTIIFVTHNEKLLKQVATRLIIFDGGGIQVLDQTYEKFLSNGGWGDENEISPKGAPLGLKGNRQESENKQLYLDRKELKRQLKTAQKQQIILEKAVNKLENEAENNARMLSDACLNKDINAIRNLGLSAKNLNLQMESTYQELEKWMIEEEQIREKLEV